MITIFHFITAICAASGLLLGIAVGTNLSGWVGGSFGAVAGLYAGVVIGRLPDFFARRALVRRIRAKTTNELKTALKGDEFYIFHFIIAELAVRGEDIHSELNHISSLLASENHAARTCGWKTLRYFYPKEATELAGYDPKEPVDLCREKAQSLRNSV